MDKHGVTIYTTYISVDLAHMVFHAKVGKGGIIHDNVTLTLETNEKHTRDNLVKYNMGKNLTIHHKCPFRVEISFPMGQNFTREEACPVSG